MTIDHIIQKYPTPIREDTFTAIVISNFQCKPNRKRFRIETTAKMSCIIKIAPAIIPIGHMPKYIGPTIYHITVIKKNNVAYIEKYKHLFTMFIYSVTS